jgi:hypothetical protein
LLSVPLGRISSDIEGLEVERWANSTSTILSWDPNAFNASHVDIEVSLFDKFQFLLHQGGLTRFQQVPNTGNYHLDYSSENIPNPSM